MNDEAVNSGVNTRREDMTREETLMHQVSILWDIIDDIDTYSDMAKSNDKTYRGLVERRQNDRWKTGITCDGHELDLHLPSFMEVTDGN